jgi:hypothetical protein
MIFESHPGLELNLIISSSDLRKLPDSQNQRLQIIALKYLGILSGED